MQVIGLLRACQQLRPFDKLLSQWWTPVISALGSEGQGQGQSGL